MCRMLKRRTKTFDINMNEVGMSNYHCYSCDKDCRSAQALDRHILKKHGDKKKPKRGFKRREK